VPRAQARHEAGSRESWRAAGEAVLHKSQSHGPKSLGLDKVLGRHTGSSVYGWGPTGFAGQIGPVDRFEGRTPRAKASGRRGVETHRFPWAAFERRELGRAAGSRWLIDWDKRAVPYAYLGREFLRLRNYADHL